MVLAEAVANALGRDVTYLTGRTLYLGCCA